MVAHPCFLYESLWCIVGFLVLHFYSKKFRKFDGEIFLLYIGWYGAGRFWIEGLRTDSLYIPGTDLKVSQLVAGTCVIFSIVILIAKYISIKKNGNVFYYETEESKELLRLRDERLQGQRNRRGKNADAETDVHILAEDEPEGVSADSAEEAPANEAPAEENHEEKEEAVEDGSAD